MSLWLRKTSELEEYAFKRALWGALVLYLLIVVLLFVCFGPQKHTVALSMPRHAVPVPVMFHSWGKRGSCGMGRAQRLIGVRHLLKRHKKMNKNEKLLKKQSEKKEASRGGIKKKKPQVVESKKITPEKIVPKKTEQKSKEQPKLSIKEPKASKKELAQKEKLVSKKMAEPKKTIPEKTPEKTVKKEATPEPEPELTQEPEQESEDQAALAAESEMDDSNDDDEIEAAFGVSEDGEVFDEEGVSREGLAVMRSVGRAWRPPRGLSPLLSARLIVSLYDDGSIEKVVIEKKSGVLAFDMAARAALWRAEYPSIFWGKNIAVVFGKPAS